MTATKKTPSGETEKRKWQRDRTRANIGPGFTFTAGELREKTESKAGGDL